MVGVLAVGLAACGSSGGSGGGGGGSGVVEMDSLANVPDMDPSNYDFSSTSASAMIAKAFGDQVGDDSTAGCRMNQEKLRLLNESLLAKMILTYLQQIEAGALLPDGSALVIPEDSWGYYQMEDLPMAFNVWDDQTQESELVQVTADMKARMMYRPSENAIWMDGCAAIPALNIDERLLNELRIANDAGHVTGYFIVSNPGDPTNANANMRIDLDITGYSETNDVRDWTTAEFMQVQYEGANSQKRVTFSADQSDPASPFNMLVGIDSWEWQGNTGVDAAYAMWNATVGTAKVSYDDQWGQGTSVQSFSIAAGANEFEPTMTVIANDDSPYYDDVNAATLPSDLPTSLSFVDGWDCSGDFTQLTITGVDTSPAIAIEAERSEVSQALEQMQCWNP